MKPPIYEPKGKAKEYGDMALNIYTGCPHRCYYCFAPGVLHKKREAFHYKVEPQPGIVDEVRKQLERERITGKLIHLCFTCDPYPTDCDSSATREIITLLKEHGNHIQILTKGAGSRDLDLLDSEDWYGISYAGYIHPHPGYFFPDDPPPAEEPGSAQIALRLAALYDAHQAGIRTWASIEPVLHEADALAFLNNADYIDRFKIGKLNYHPSSINWAEFGKKAEDICRRRGLDYYIKDSLRLEMERSSAGEK